MDECRPVVVDNHLECTCGEWAAWLSSPDIDERWAAHLEPEA